MAGIDGPCIPAHPIAKSHDGLRGRSSRALETRDCPTSLKMVKPAARR
jgi:hypothetical protein